MKLVWLHGGSLSPTDPALLAHPNSPAIFVFDQPFLEKTKIAFPRLQFIFESAVEAFAQRSNSRICVGVQAEEIIAFAKLHGCNEIHTTKILSPELDTTLDALKTAGLRVFLYAPERLTSYTGRIKRFSAFWRAVEKEVLHG